MHIQPNKEKALMLAKRELSALVHDSVVLEGINFTLPEIQTLLEGITVGGHKLADQQIALNQAAAWKLLFYWVEHGYFCLNKKYVCDLHAVAANEEALGWGVFRRGQVTISGTSYIPPSWKELNRLFNSMIEDSLGFADIYDRAIFVFLTMARTQFFYDVNKRTGRMIMNGLLLSYGYPAINLPAKRQGDFNKLMLEFYRIGDYAPMTDFLKSCLDPRIVEIMNE